MYNDSSTGVYTRDSKEVFDFISKLISQSKRKCEYLCRGPYVSLTCDGGWLPLALGLSLDSVYRCLNRTIFL